MFKRGDVVKVKREWLSPSEKANPKYAEKIYFVLDCYNGLVELACEADTIFGYARYTWSADTVYKVGEVDPNSFE